jgi:hypothetical protein
MKLDQTRPYSTVYGKPGVKFEQDGVEYDAYGKPVQEEQPRPILKVKNDVASKRPLSR